MVPPAEAGWSPEVEAAIRALVGDTTPIDGEIKFQAPETAENGAFVPVTVSIDSPMTADNHIRAIHLFATKNPTPGVASFQLSPANGRATVSTRIRLAEHQTILAYAVASDGSVRRAAAQVRVTVGGCLT
jgi:sulfur-oxidizing protein SoxY